MKTTVISSSWLHRTGRRLDCGPYTSGGLQAKIRLEGLSVPKDPLHTLTSGHDGGIYNGPKFSRTWVDDPAFGVPFLGSSAMLQADLSDLPLLRKRDALSPRLSFLRLSPGMTLISCSGTIGRMVYSRPDMDGIWSSQHIMKVVPDAERVRAGYLYAFLSSRFGVAIVTAGTYGSIIQSIEPHHIVGLPVPRFSAEVEERAHLLVESAAHARARATELLALARDRFMAMLGRVNHESSSIWTATRAADLQARADAYYFSAPCLQARAAFDQAADSSLLPLKEVAEVFIPGIFKRRYAEEPAFGYPYITGADVFQLAPTSERYLMRRVAHEYDLVVRRGMILIQEAGQLGGLIGHSSMVGRYMDGFAVSNNMVRVTAREESDTGYLYAVLSSEPGIRLIAREAAGSSIPHLDVTRVREIRIPWAPAEERAAIGDLVIKARDLRDDACDREDAARALVEQAIEEAA